MDNRLSLESGGMESAKRTKTISLRSLTIMLLLLTALVITVVNSFALFECNWYNFLFTILYAAAFVLFAVLTRRKPVWTIIPLLLSALLVLGTGSYLIINYMIPESVLVSSSVQGITTVILLATASPFLGIDYVLTSNSTIPYAVFILITGIVWLIWNTFSMCFFKRKNNRAA